MTYYSIGSFTLPAIWLAALSALTATALLNKVARGKKTEDWYWNGFILYFLIWKLSYIIFNFSMFIDMPFSVIYFNGGVKGHLLALTMLSLYLLIIAVKKYPFIYTDASFIMLLYFICYETLIAIFEKNYLESIAHFTILAFYLFTQRNKILSKQVFSLFILIELLLVSYFHTLFSQETLTFSILGLTVLIITAKQKGGATD